VARRRPDLHEVVAIFVGGALGALARAGVDEALPVRPGTWPWATFLVNIAGAALLGWAVTRLSERLPPSRYRRPFIGTGVCGALTTFSTLQLELLRLLDDGSIGLAVGYVAASLVAGFGAVWLMSGLVRRGGLA
jgi:fluoride exporter